MDAQHESASGTPPTVRNQGGNHKRLARLEISLCFFEPKLKASEQRDFDLDLGMFVRTKSSTLAVKAACNVALGAAQMQLTNLELPRIEKRGHEHSIRPRDPSSLPQHGMLPF
jgi:hypothetical protein